ncbi:ABC transporter ATP-binding protein [Neorhizobium galegae]|uniref:Aliphatic sulfonates transport ATP-binding subunit n=1 Tax=Neorhizobium galegae bv. orientalis str. HAMBI 540 TaxID=1028800 RepID=A0A068T1N1_NEOGA|nr:ABC transporter ATP-binding protein [Neorhizobium galegae]MCQ1854942.1 ABC transporter ATP-binding protein [Neorhizobium galegae]CDN51375.1 Aliphatic sulfonates transport ATP-binding subunit [Neorhizobium galegae bv. orientalis str. HAMBI 540]CDZ49670.1 Aliphatic sulfonates transport ATP-binding subunit [Neorhizobium galegae bv. orientalis]
MNVHTSSFSSVSLRNLSRGFSDKTILKDITLEIPRGQFVALLGESGSGKTTLLRALAGLDDDAVTKGEFRRPANTSVLFQDARLLPWMSVIDNLTLGLRRSDAKAAALAMLQAVGLGDKVHVWPSTLSGGQKQRAALARSLLRRPELLLADEPFGGLDALTRIRMHGLLFHLVEQNKPTVVLVTHDVDEALLLSDRILVLKDGRIAEDHQVELTHPRSPGHPAFIELRRMLLASFGVEQNLI